MKLDATLITEWLKEEISKEVHHLVSISGPTGMRNSVASAMGLARNDVRYEVLRKIQELAEGDGVNDIKKLTDSQEIA